MVVSTTISPETIMSFGRTGSPMRDELMRQKQYLETTTIMSPATSDINAVDVNTIWSLPTDCTALIHAFLAAFSVIIVSELGDKTFIITAIMAMKNSRLPVFLASACALLFMTILSVVMGVAVTVIPEVYTHYASIVLFICFGLKMLKEAYDLDDASEESEFDEVKRSLEEEEETSDLDKNNNNNNNNKEVDEELSKNNNTDKEQEEEDDKSKMVSSSTDISAHKQLNDVGGANKTTFTKPGERTNFFKEFIKTLHFAPLFIKVFTMVFVAEWGDRSQISTVILAAREDVIGVFVGSFIGHVICTGLAVIGGRFVAEMISVRTSKY